MPDQGSRRTVVIRGRVVDRYSPRQGSARGSGYPRPRSQGRTRSKPDRIAMWAVLLGVLLLVVAATSSHAAMVPAVAPHLSHLLASHGAASAGSLGAR